MQYFRVISIIICIILIIVSAVLTGCSDDDDKGTGPQEGGWVYKPLGDGIAGRVNAITDYSGKLYVGGNFTTAGGQTVNYIASWDSTNWAPLGIGTSWPVYAFTEYDGKLIVGGSFGSAGGIQVNKVAAWDGSSWSALGTGLNGNYRVNDMCVLRDTLFVTGVEDPYADEKLFIAAWDGATWTMIESGVPGQGIVACTYSGGLLIGGFYINGGIQEPFVKTISAGQWYDWDHHSLTGSLFDLVFYNGYTYSSGNGSLPVKYFSVSWHNVGSTYFAKTGNSSPYVRALCELGGNLIAGGEFDSIGGNAVNNLASWNGTAWSSLGSGIIIDQFGIEALYVWQDKLYVGGSFTQSGSGVPVNNIAEVSFE